MKGREMNRGLSLVASKGMSINEELEPVDPEMYLYRNRTAGLLRRYFRLSMELGRVPSMLGREFFRAKVTSYRMHNFEDVVIFVHDVERCLECLDDFSRQLIARMTLQEYSAEEAARILGVSARTVDRRYPEALDRMSAILVEMKLLEKVGMRGRMRGPQEEAIRAGERKPVARVEACQEGKNAIFAVSCRIQGK